MSAALKIGCQCGALRGMLQHAAPPRGERMRCYCRDCQSYAHHLGVADRVLDSHGGTALFETTSGGLQITQGQEYLAALRLSPKGPIRWYASCCHTPIANTMANPGLPFLALMGACWQGDTQALGAERVAVFGKDAHGERSQIQAHDKIPLSAMLRVARRLLRARLRGEHRRSALFDDRGQPCCHVRTLTREERQAARALCA